MIAACPNCDAKYRVDEAKVAPEGARLRCAKCQAVFRVRAPAAAAPAAASKPEVAEPATAARGAEFDPVAEREYDRARLVLIADPRDDSGKATASAVSGWGLESMLVPDGVEAMLWIQRARPRVVVIDAALPKMYGFQICEIVKRNESLSDTKVILVGAIHNSGRYRRPPTDLYGADCYLEQPDLPDGLKALLIDYGLPIVDPNGVTQSQAPAPAPAPGPQPVAEQPAPIAVRPTPVAPSAEAPTPQPDIEAPAPVPEPAAPAPASDGLDAERENAERLARIVVSDIVLYQGEKFEEAIRSGNLLEALDSAIEEGRTYFRQRINETIRNERDHLMDELMRVARERGMG